MMAGRVHDLAELGAAARNEGRASAGEHDQQRTRPNLPATRKCHAITSNDRVAGHRACGRAWHAVGRTGAMLRNVFWRPAWAANLARVRSAISPNDRSKSAISPHRIRVVAAKMTIDSHTKPATSSGCGKNEPERADRGERENRVVRQGSTVSVLLCDAVRRSRSRPIDDCKETRDQRRRLLPTAHQGLDQRAAVFPGVEERGLRQRGEAGSQRREAVGIQCADECCQPTSPDRLRAIRRPAVRRAMRRSQRPGRRSAPPRTARPRTAGWAGASPSCFPPHRNRSPRQNRRPHTGRAGRAPGRTAHRTTGPASPRLRHRNAAAPTSPRVRG